MLPHASHSRGTVSLFSVEHQAIALVFGRPSGRIAFSPNRAAILAGQDDGGAVKRDLPGFRVLLFSVHLPLILCLLLLVAVLPAAGQSTDENKPKDEAKREEVKEVKKED